MIVYTGMIIAMIFGMQFFLYYKLKSRIDFWSADVENYRLNCAAVQVEVNGIIGSNQKILEWNDANWRTCWNRLEKLENNLIKPSKKGKSK
jgi:hypothetical protein